MIFDKYIAFLDTLYSEMEKRGIDTNSFKLDHIAFRTSSEKEYEKLMLELEKLGKMVHENYISGNTVRIFKLNKPLIYKDQSMNAIEFIGPNENINYPTDFEHAEITITEDFEEFANKYPNLEWDKRVVNRPEFPMLKLPLQKFMQVKFNHIPVLEMARQLNEK